MLMQSIRKSPFILKNTAFTAVSLNLHSNASFSSFSEQGLSATADLCDQHSSSPHRLQVLKPNHLRHFGATNSFFGQIRTVRCHECNVLVRRMLEEENDGCVLVVDGGDSSRVALLGDNLATLALQNGWKGLIINGCIRDSQVIRNLVVNDKKLGVMARGTNPIKSRREHENEGYGVGEVDGNVAFGEVEFIPGQFVYADEDGVLVHEQPLHDTTTRTT